MTKSETPSKVPPLLIATIVCDAVAVDRASGKHSLIGIFSVLISAAFPTQRPMSLYVKVTDAQGRYPWHVDFTQLNNDVVLAKAEGEFNATDRKGYVEFSLDFPPLTFPEPGRYQFRIFASEMYLGGAFIDAKPLETIKPH